MNTNNNSTRDMQAYMQIKLEYTENEYNELTDSLYSYMTAYISGNNLESIMLLDEIENIIGVNKHDEVVNFILGR